MVWLNFLNESMLRLWRINSVQKGLEEILQTAMKLSKTEKGYIQLLDIRKQALFIKDQQGFDEQFLEYCKMIVPESNTVCSLALNRREQVVLEDIEKDANLSQHIAIARRNNFRSVQSIPLLDRLGLPIAVLSVHSPNPHHFDALGLKRMQLYVHYAEGFLENRKQQSALKDVNIKLEKRVAKRTSELSDALQREKDSVEMKSRFFSMASHEFRTPLSIIITSADLAKRYAGIGDHDKRIQHIERIKKSAGNLTEMLNDSMHSDKIENGIMNMDKSKYNVKSVAEDVIFELKDLCKKNQVIYYENVGLVDFYTDIKTLKNILLNIISNAIKYSTQNIYVTLKVKSSKMILTAKDSGIGIPKSEQKHLYSRFFRGSNTTGINGMGLGLHGVYCYTKSLNGKIKVNSQIDVGTTVQISIPNGN
ncbi:MAG: GAF domain-containing sensor histidine kinase [Sphingomonadales bacterium]|nr:GAF domain-containing sensor histidine kinase [Sphingomonadales bacterium]